MSAECSTEHRTSQQSDKNFEQEQPNSQSTGSDVTAAASLKLYTIKTLYIMRIIVKLAMQQQSL